MNHPVQPASGIVDREGAARQHLIATGLLVAAALVFGATFLEPDPSFWVLLLRHVTEASLIGGMADWFAVVALFRRPLGLPIPHTGVIPRNKDRIARGLGSFVEMHFLDPETVAARLRSADLSMMAARWLSAAPNASAVADRTVQGLAMFIAAVPEPELRAVIRRAIVRGASSLDLASALSLALRILFESGRHQELFDEVITAARGWVTRHPDRIEALVLQHSAWWVPKVVDKSVSRAVVEEIARFLEELMRPDAEARRQLDRITVRLINELLHSPQHRERLEAVKHEVLGSQQIEAALDGAARELRRLVLEDLAERRSAARDAIADALQAFGRRLEQDEALRQRIERRLIWLARSLVLPWREGIGRFIADVMRSWEQRSVAERLENAVGRDLQYVRINGTVVGGLVGGVLFLLTTIVP